METNKTKVITLGGLFAAIYVVISILSVYVFPAISVLGLLILPIFSAYFSSLHSFKNTLIFNIAVVITCFIASIGDPFYTLLYVIPTLIVGDLFGLLNKLKTKFYTTIFLQTIAYCITNIFVLFLGEIIYETSIIRFIISDEFIFQNFSLSILFILSGAEAIFSSMYISEKLQYLNIKKEKEITFPNYGYITYIVLFLLSIFCYFISKNFYFLFTTIMFLISYPILKEFIGKIKYKNVFLIAYILVSASACFLLGYVSQPFLSPLIFILPLILYCLVKIIFYIYNIIRK